MDVLVHTCGWIEWLVDGELADRFADALGNPARLIVPTVVQFELYKWTRRKRDESTALEVVAATEQATIVPLDSSIALLAADLALEHRMSFADAVVYGTARTLDACVHTRDDRSRRSPACVTSAGDSNSQARIPTSSERPVTTPDGTGRGHIPDENPNHDSARTEPLLHA